MHKPSWPLSEQRGELSVPDGKPLLRSAEAVAEAERCLGCTDAPCTKACPTSIDVPSFIKKIATGNLRGSARTILDQNILGYSCARVCPVEVLCEGACVYHGLDHHPIAIGKLQRFAVTHGTKDLSELPWEAPSRAQSVRRYACVGAGPASVGFAGVMARAGHSVTLFEKDPFPGGLNTTGVAPYKLLAHESLAEVTLLKSLGVEIRTGAEVGKDIHASELLSKYDAVFLGLGLGGDSTLGIPDEAHPHVVGATVWIRTLKLRTPSPDPKGRSVLVVGGGNTAIDVAREAASLGARKVTMVYRRGLENMSGYAHELTAARSAGVEVVPHAVPIAFVTDGDHLVGLEVTRHATRERIPGDMAIVGIGQSKLRALASTFPGVVLDEKGRVVVDGDGVTGNPKVLSGGDCVNGGKEVVNAVAEGRDAARALLRRLRS